MKKIQTTTQHLAEHRGYQGLINTNTKRMLIFFHVCEAIIHLSPNSLTPLLKSRRWKAPRTPS